MLETSARLLRLLSLLQMRRFWTGSELASRLEVTHRTLRRDISRLRTLGYPINGEAGVAGGYQLGAGATLPPLSLDDDEALAVSIGLRTAAGQAASGIEEAALRALIKLERVLPPRLRRRASALRTSIVMFERSGPKAKSSILQALAVACDDHARVELEYRDREGARTVRELEPLGLVHTGYRWYLVAWDLGRGDWRSFRVDRIASEITSGARFVPRPPPDDGDLRKYISRSVSTDAYKYKARILLHAPLAEMTERIPASSGQLEAVDAERCALSVGTHSLEGLASWISHFGVDFEVVDPPELVSYLRELHQRLGKALEQASSRG